MKVTLRRMIVTIVAFLVVPFLADLHVPSVVVMLVLPSPRGWWRR